MRLFDVAEANRLVPYLSQVFESVRPLVSRAQEIQEQLEAPEALAELAPERLEALRREGQVLVEQIRGQLIPLDEMGIEVKAADGLVDFRANLGGKLVYLCWKYGEREVAHWHELDAGFAGRQPIRDPGEFAPCYLS